MISWPTAWRDPAAQRRLARGSSILLAIVLAWLLTKVFWLLASPGEPPLVTVPPSAVPAPQATRLADLEQYHLFGEVGAEATVAAYHDAPETALNLELRGIVSSADPESGFAIIVAGGRQAAYDVGDEVPGGAEVRGIYADRVVLLHNGRYETLRLPVERAIASGAQDAPVPGDDGSTATLPLDISGWQERLSVNLDDNRYSLIPVRSGGYRLFLSRDAQRMARLGLRNGDVIRSANGIPLNSQADVERVMAQVLAGETLTLLLVRDGAEMTLTPDLEQFVPGVR